MSRPINHYHDDASFFQIGDSCSAQVESSAEPFGKQHTKSSKIPFWVFYFLVFVNSMLVMTAEKTPCHSCPLPSTLGFGNSASVLQLKNKGNSDSASCTGDSFIGKNSVHDYCIMTGGTVTTVRVEVHCMSSKLEWSSLAAVHASVRYLKQPCAKNLTQKSLWNGGVQESTTAIWMVYLWLL
jgi:hypothetical protein